MVVADVALLVDDDDFVEVFGGADVDTGLVVFVVVGLNFVVAAAVGFVVVPNVVVAAVADFVTFWCDRFNVNPLIDALIKKSKNSYISPD